MKIIKSQKNELIIAALAIFSYCTSLINDFHTDDWRVLSLLRDGFSLNDFLFMDNPGRFRPIVNSILYLRYELFGLYTPAYYALNIGLHILFCLMLYRFLLKIGLETKPALLSAAIFAVFFPHYEAVLWLYGINRILGAIFWIASLRLLLSYLDSPNLKNRLLFGAIFLLGFFVAEDFAVAAVGFILFAVIFASSETRWKSTISAAITSVIVLSIYFVLRLLVVGQMGTSEEHYSLGIHIVVKTWEYLQWTILPPPGHPYFQAISSHLGPQMYAAWNIGSVAATIGLLALLVYALFRGGRAAGFFALFIFLTLLPAMPYDYKVTSRNLYIPSIGLAVVAGIMLDRLINSLRRNLALYLVYICVTLYAAGSVGAIWVTARTYHKNQVLVSELVADLAGTNIEMNNYPYILFDDLPGRANIGPAMVFHFHYDHDIIASNDPINGPIDIKAAARGLRDKGLSFLVFDYRDGHLVEATGEYKSGRKTE